MTLLETEPAGPPGHTHRRDEPGGLVKFHAPEIVFGHESLG